MNTLLIYNPAAGRPRRRGQVNDAVAELRAAGWSVDLAETVGADSATQFAHQAVDGGYATVVVIGGDGTVNQVVNGLLQARRDHAVLPALGILPAGTANVLARDLGLPVPGRGQAATIPAAARVLTQSRIAPIDIGVARNAQRERYFACWAGIGLDAAITADVMANPQAKRRFGSLYFVTNLLARLPGIQTAPIYRVSVDGELWEGKGILAVASNIQHYAGVLDMAPRALLNDGLLDVTFFHGITLWNGASTLARLLASRHPSDPNVRYAQAKEVVVDAERPQPVHVDAEPFDVTPVTISVLPRVLPLLVPPSAAGERLVPAVIA